MRKFLLLSIFLCAVSLGAQDPAFWREDFRGGNSSGNWRVEGRRLLVPATRFYLRQDAAASGGSVLVVDCNRSTALYLCDMSGKVDLEKTPIMRWRWRALRLPPGADGRPGGKDDQAVAIYVGSGSLFRQYGVGYRWETDTPRGNVSRRVYGGILSMNSICVRNKESSEDGWIVESCNVREDFRRFCGRVPERFALSIGGNSQHTGSRALAEIDYIEFIGENALLARNHTEKSGNQP